MIVPLYSIAHVLRAKSISPFSPQALIDIQFNYVFKIYQVVIVTFLQGRRVFEACSLCLF